VVFIMQPSHRERIIGTMADVQKAS